MICFNAFQVNLPLILYMLEDLNFLGEGKVKILILSKFEFSVLLKIASKKNWKPCLALILISISAYMYMYALCYSFAMPILMYSITKAISKTSKQKRGQFSASKENSNRIMHNVDGNLKSKSTT